jgi:hypothetical protein
MTELKTLKDIYSVIDGKTDLKEEALKQLKTEFYDFPIFENYCNDCDWLIEKAVKDYIKWFFDITDKEIEGVKNNI